jgi:hypothetical protein
MRRELIFAVAAVCGIPGAGPAQTTSALEPVAAGGMAAPGVPDGTFVAGSGVFGPPVLNEHGALAFYGTIRRGGDPDRTFTGIWVGRPGSLQLAVLTGDQAPGLPGGVTFRSVSRLPVLDDAGCVAFVASLTGPDVDEDENGESLWRACSGHLQLVARQGWQAPGLPDGVNLSTFASLSGNRSGALAFEAMLQGPAVDSTNNVAVFLGFPEALEPVVRRGDALPGQPAGVTFSNLSFPQVSVNRAGEAVFAARLAAPGSESGLYALLYRGPGGLEVLAREGADAPEGAGANFGEIAGFGLNDAGQVVFAAQVGVGSAVYVGRPGNLRKVASGEGGSVSGRAAINAAGEIVFSDGGSIRGGSPSSLRVLVAEGEAVSIDDPRVVDDCIDTELESCTPVGVQRGRSRIWNWNDAGQLLYTSEIVGSLVPFGYHSLWRDWALVGRTGEALDPSPFFPPLIHRFSSATLNNAGQVAALLETSSTRSPEMVALWGAPADPGDADGIDAPVDGRFTSSFIDESDVFTSAFTDQHRGGSSFGSIVDRGGLLVLARDAIDPARGLNVLAAAGGTGTATVAACGMDVNLTEDDSVVITCGSLTIEVLVGPVEIVLAPGLVLTVAEGGTARVEDLDAGDFAITNVGAYGILEVTGGGMTARVAPGEMLVASAEQNHAPLADAGSDATVEATSAHGAVVTLDASGSTDADPNDTLSYVWHGPFGEAYGASPSVTVPLGISTIVLTVTDSAGATATDTVVVTVVDTTPPTIAIAAPGATTYLLGQEVVSSYTCTDTVTGMRSCGGPVPSGAAFDTASTGAKVFTVSAVDGAGNVSSRSVSYAVSYGVCLLYDPSHAKKSGSTIPIKIQLCDANGHNVSAPAVVVAAQQVVKLADGSAGGVVGPGEASPDRGFRYHADLGAGGGYKFNLKTTGLSAGTYAIVWIATGDPTVHGSDVVFQIR